MTSELRIGCSSWTSEAWWGRVYPRSVADTDRLRWYAKFFDCVEVDSSYYRTPPRGMVTSWARKTPESFRFTLKFPKDLMDPEHPPTPEGLSAFVESVRGLGPKLGGVLLQFSPSFRRSEANRSFLGGLLDALDPSLLLAVEFRDPSWFQPGVRGALVSELSSRKVALAWSFLTYLDCPPLVTSDQLYLRFIGDHSTVPAEEHGEIRVDRSREMELWAARLKAEGERVQRTFVFFNNHFAGFAPESANQFRVLMGVPPVPLRPFGPGTLDG